MDFVEELVAVVVEELVAVVVGLLESVSVQFVFQFVLSVSLARASIHSNLHRHHRHINNPLNHCISSLASCAWHEVCCIVIRD